MTSVIRKIDENGRIIIPKDIRKDLKLYPNDLIKISIDNNNIIISKKNINNAHINIIKKIVECLYKTINYNIVITSMDSIILSKPNINVKQLSNDLISKINNRKEIISNETLYISDEYVVKNFILNPLIIDGNCIGSLICFSEKNIEEKDKKIIEITKLYLENILEE